ncbi:MAG TPA: carboxylating nicotinate-nucleotide diphosphorylase [Kofleriaceae bacterium]|jgi:nicotinate-nucleotide pyrophosphorylase (carboxylating)
MPLAPLPSILIEPIVRAALLEDLGRAGDLTTDAIVPSDARAKVSLAVRQAGVVAGLDVALMAFRLIDPGIVTAIIRADGSHVAPGDVIATLEGPARGLLTAERVALNFLCHLSGIATATAEVVETVRGTKARVIDIRKTLPGLRAIQKYAVRAGGGANHRFGLDDGILIKDNHIAVAGGIRPALERARAAAGHMVKIEIEVDTLDQLAEVLTFEVDAVLLDNMGIEELRRAVGLVDGRAIIEASGGITPGNAGAIAATGVDLVSMGWLTQSVRALDIGLDYIS